MSRPRRLDRDMYLGLRQYFLTICSYRRSRPFTDARVVSAVMLQFLQSATAEGFAISAYCFMPDHIHALITARSENADFHRFVRLTKQRSGFAYKQSSGQRLWQDSFFDRTIRQNENIVELIGYIVANPVRAGLAKVPSEYPYWGCEDYSREELLDFLSIESRRV